MSDNNNIYPMADDLRAMRDGLFGDRRIVEEFGTPAPQPETAGDTREVIAARYGIPAELIHGDTPEELEAHAQTIDTLRAQREAARTPVVEAQGRTGPKYAPPVNPLRRITHPDEAVPHDVAHPDHLDAFNSSPRHINL